MVAASALDEDWLPTVAQSQGPYFFVAEGVLVYLPEDQVMAALARQSATITRPPRAMRAQLPFGYRHLVPLADPFLGQAMDLTLFRASSPAAGGHAATTPEDGPT